MSIEENPLIPNPGNTLADSFYGSTTPENPTLPEGEPAEEAAPPAETAPEAEAPAPDAEVSPEEDAPPAAPDETVDSDPDAPEEVQLSTFEQLAEHLETEQTFLEDLTIKQKVNGEQVDVKLADALQTHRQVVAGDAYLADAKEKAKAIVNDVKAQNEAMGETAVVAATLIQNLEGQFLADVNSINWDQLRKDDPAEYSAKQLDVEARRKQIDKVKTDATAQYREHLEKAKQKEHADNLARIPAEHQKLIEAVPEWEDEKKATAEQKEVVEYMQNLGFNQDQIQAASFNALFLQSMIKAKRYDSAKGKSDAIRKKVVTIPKVIKPGAITDKPAKPKADATDRVSTLYGS